MALTDIERWIKKRDGYRFTDSQPLYCTPQGGPIGSSNVRELLPFESWDLGHPFRHRDSMDSRGFGCFSMGAPATSPSMAVLCLSVSSCSAL